MKSLRKISACVIALVACAGLSHAAIQGVSLTLVDKTPFKPIVVKAQTVVAITLLRAANRVKSVDVTFSLAGHASLRTVSLVSRSQSLLRSKYEQLQEAIAQKRTIAISATAVRVFYKYVSNIDLIPLGLAIGPPPPTPTPTPTPTPAPTPTPSPTPDPTPTPTPDRVVLDQLVGDFGLGTLNVYDTNAPGQPAIDGALRSIALVQQSDALSIDVDFALADGTPRQLAITATATDLLRMHYRAIGEVWRSGRPFCLVLTAYQDPLNAGVYRTAVESAVLRIQALPAQAEGGLLPNVDLTVSPGSDPLVIANGVQTIETQSIDGAVALRVSFFVPSDTSGNHHWLTLNGTPEAVFTQFASLASSINSRWRFGIYAYTEPSTDPYFYEARLGVHALILSLQRLTGAALPGITATAIAGRSTPISGMPVRAIYFYYDPHSGPYAWVQGSDASGNEGGLMLMNATSPFYDNLISALAASEAMSSVLAGYGTPHATYANTYVVDLALDALYLTAGLTPSAPERMIITTSHFGETPITSSQVSSTNVYSFAGTVVSESYFIASADGIQRPLKLTGSTNPAVQSTFDRMLRGIAAGRNVSIMALNAASDSSDGFVMDVASSSFILSVQ